MSRGVLISVAMLVASGSAAFGQGPFIENQYELFPTPMVFPSAGSLAMASTANADDASPKHDELTAASRVLPGSDIGRGESRGIDIYVDPTWTFDEINAILDSDSATLAKAPYENTVAGDGDIIHFAAGQYNIPQITDAHLEVRVGGTGTDPDLDVVTIDGAGMNQTNFNGPTPTSGRVIEVYNNNVILSNFSTSGSKFGIIVDGQENTDYKNIRFNNILTIGHAKHFLWDLQEASGAGRSGGVTSVWGSNLYILGGGTGFHSNGSGTITANTKGFGVSNTTIDNALLGMDTPYVTENQQVVDVIGQNDWFDIFVIGTNSAWSENAYGGFGSPEGISESENGSDSLEVRGIGTDLNQDGVPDFNWEFADQEDAGLVRNLEGLLMPTLDSPLANLTPVDLGNGRIVFRNGYVGAIPPESAQAPLPASAPHDTLKNRYISFDPNNHLEVALRLDMVDGPGAAGALGYIGAPDANGVSRVVSEPVYRVWTTNPIHVGDCGIVPAALYEIRADDGQTLSSPLALETIDRPGDQFWADIVGSFDAPTQTWTGPNGIVNFNDIAASIQTFQEKPTAPHFTATDLHPEVPNETTNFNDIGMIIGGFKGEPYPYANPMDCP